ncbi:hypothetical protein F5B19DRAFT_323513 [Rostrohypoxylon terebratum]|nr:hypothetical protein F5B19DRAFT_323513 [Rostrohypoxylon terebratum]
MLYYKLYLAAFLTGAIAAPVQNDETPSQPGTDGSQYHTSRFDIDKRAEGDIGGSPIVYRRNKRDEESATYIPEGFAYTRNEEKRRNGDGSAAKRCTDDDSAGPY